MALFDLDNYHDLALDYGEKVIGFFPETRKLKSGRMSRWYWNGRLFLDYKEPMQKLARFVLDFCEDNEIMPDYFVAVPDGVTKLADYLNAELGGKQVMARANPKAHGDPRDAFFIGPVEEGDNVGIMEDVTTTGGSLLGQIGRCLAAKMNIKATLCECNRLEKAQEELDNGQKRDLDYGVVEAVSRFGGKGIRHYAMTDAQKILPVAFSLWQPESGVDKGDVAAAIEHEYADHGTAQIKLVRSSP